jgi:hypothetical protein
MRRAREETPLSTEPFSYGEIEMKTLALTALAVLTMSTSAFALDKHTAVAPEPIDRVESPVPDVSGLSESLQRAVLWAWFLTQHPDYTVLDLAAGVRFVDGQMKRYAK